MLTTWYAAAQNIIIKLYLQVQYQICSKLIQTAVKQDGDNNRMYGTNKFVAKMPNLSVEYH